VFKLTRGKILDDPRLLAAQYKINCAKPAVMTLFRSRGLSESQARAEFRKFRNEALSAIHEGRELNFESIKRR